MEKNKQPEMLSLLNIKDYHNLVFGDSIINSTFLKSNHPSTVPNFSGSVAMTMGIPYPIFTEMIDNVTGIDYSDYLYFLFNSSNIETSHFGFKKLLRTAITNDFNDDLIHKDEFNINLKPYITLTKKGIYYNDQVQNNRIKRVVRLFNYPFNINTFFKMRAECCDDYALVVKNEGAFYSKDGKYSMNSYHISLRNQKSKPISVHMDGVDKICTGFIHTTTKLPTDKYYRGYDFIILE